MSYRKEKVTKEKRAVHSHVKAVIFVIVVMMSALTFGMAVSAATDTATIQGGDGVGWIPVLDADINKIEFTGTIGQLNTLLSTYFSNESYGWKISDTVTREVDINATITDEFSNEDLMYMSRPWKIKSLNITLSVKKFTMVYNEWGTGMMVEDKIDLTGATMYLTGYEGSELGQLNVSTPAIMYLALRGGSAGISNKTYQPNEIKVVWGDYYVTDDVYYLPQNTTIAEALDLEIPYTGVTVTDNGRNYNIDLIYDLGNDYVGNENGGGAPFVRLNGGQDLKGMYDVIKAQNLDGAVVVSVPQYHVSLKGDTDTIYLEKVGGKNLSKEEVLELVKDLTDVKATVKFISGGTFTVTLSPGKSPVVSDIASTPNPVNPAPSQKNNSGNVASAPKTPAEQADILGAGGAKTVEEAKILKDLKGGVNATGADGKSVPLIAVNDKGVVDVAQYLSVTSSDVKTALNSFIKLNNKRLSSKKVNNLVNNAVVSATVVKAVDVRARDAAAITFDGIAIAPGEVVYAFHQKSDGTWEVLPVTILADGRVLVSSQYWPGPVVFVKYKTR